MNTTIKSNGNFEFSQPPSRALPAGKKKIDWKFHYPILKLPQPKKQEEVALWFVYASSFVIVDLYLSNFVLHTKKWNGGWCCPRVLGRSLPFVVGHARHRFIRQQTVQIYLGNM